MIEDAMDTHYEPINWGLGRDSLVQARRGRACADDRGAGGRLRRATSTRGWSGIWATNEWFGGAFGWADLSVIPYLNGSSGAWRRAFGRHRSLGSGRRARTRGRPLRKAAKAAADSIKVMAMVGEAVKQRLFKREYRDHRLEWMIRSGGLDVVLEGIKADTIRFSNEFR